MFDRGSLITDKWNSMQTVC